MKYLVFANYNKIHDTEAYYKSQQNG